MSRRLTNGHSGHQYAEAVRYGRTTTKAARKYVAAVLVESALSSSSFYFQMVEFRGLEGLERKLRTGLRPELGQWCIRKPSRVSPPASLPRPSLPFSSLWPTSMTLSSSMGHLDHATMMLTGNQRRLLLRLLVTLVFFIRCLSYSCSYPEKFCLL